MKRVILCLAIFLSISSLQANAFDFTSALNFITKASETKTQESASVKTLSDIETQMANIDSAVQSSFLNIVSELSTRKETKNIKKELNSNTAALNDTISNYTTTLANNKDSVTKTINKLSAKEKTTLVNNIKTLTENYQQYLLLATDGVKAASDSIKTAQKFNEVATTISNINKIATDLKSRATTVINFANQIKTIATSAGLSVN